MSNFINQYVISDSSIKKSIVVVYQEWLNKSKMRIKYSSFCIYDGIAQNHILPYFNSYDISDITREIVDSFIDCKLQSFAPKTVRDITSVLLQILKFAQRKGYISDFDYSIDLPRLQVNELKIMSVTDEQKLNAYLKNNLNLENLGILLAKSTGIRIGELCALKWNDFDLINGTVYISKTIQRVKNHDENATSKTKVIITTPKSQKSVREIPLPDYIIPIIKKLNKGANPNTYILTGTEKYMEPRNLQKKFKILLQSLDIMYVNFHSLRHLFATRAIESDFNIKALSEILGHSSVKITLDRYAHISFELKRSNMNKIASGF
ncbi:MAG: site-specific integrase [Firmicutes bacterium]|nr:site-specific integrase [Bacillota bacterium]